jgi:hypothetical protein
MFTIAHKEMHIPDQLNLLHIPDQLNLQKIFNVDEFGNLCLVDYFIIWIRTQIKDEILEIEKSYKSFIAKNSQKIDFEECVVGDEEEDCVGTQPLESYIGFILRTIQILNPIFSSLPTDMSFLHNNLEISGNIKKSSEYLDNFHLHLLFSRVLPKYNINSRCGVYCENSGYLKFQSVFTCKNVFQVCPFELHPLLVEKYGGEEIEHMDINCRIAIKFISHANPRLCHYEGLMMHNYGTELFYEITSDTVPKRQPRSCNIAPAISSSKANKTRRSEKKKRRNLYMMKVLIVMIKWLNCLNFLSLSKINFQEFFLNFTIFSYSFLHN